MNAPMMRTKITVPRRRSDVIHRERLFNQLREYLDYKLIMVSAPAGYGKTTLLIDFIHEENIPTCWYSLDDYDQDLYRFLSHFIAAISVQFKEFGQDSLAALKNMGADQINLEAITTIIVNDLYDHVDEHFLFVIDDYHLVETEEDYDADRKKENPISNFIMHFLDYVDENCHLVILSRTLLGFRNLPKMIMRNEVTGLSFSDLAFNTGEVEQLFSEVYHSKPDDELIRQILKESEGWVTGIILTASSDGDLSNGVSRLAQSTGINIDEYWGRQILDRESDEMRSFLLYTSLLEEFNVDLCHKVLDSFIRFQSGVDTLMDEAFKKSLFLLQVPDERSGKNTLRFHHLFRDFLQKRIQDEDPENARKIRIKLAEVIASTKDWERAANIYFSLGENERVASMMIEAGSDLITDGKFKTISHWLEKLSGNIREKYPVLLSVQGASAIMHREINQGIDALSEAIEILKNLPEQKAAYYEALSRRSTGYRMIADYKKSQKDIDTLQAHFDEISNYKIKCNIYINQGLIFLANKRFAEALTQFKQADQVYFAYGDHHSRAIHAINLGMVQRELGNYDEAEKTYQDAVQILEHSGNDKQLANLYNNLAVLLHMQGRYSQAAFFLERAIQTAKFSEYLRFIAYALAGMGDLYIDIGAYQEAEVAYWQAEEILAEYDDPGLMIYIYIARVKLWLRAGDLKKIKQAYDELRDLHAGKLPESVAYQLLSSDVDYAISGEKENYYRNIKSIYEQLEKGPVGKDLIAEILIKMLIYAVEMGDEDSSANAIKEIDQMISSRTQKFSILAAAKPRLDQIENIEKELRVDQKKIRALINQVKKFGEDENEVRKRIRQHVSNMPLPKAVYDIVTLGKIEIKINNKVISNQDWQATVARDLFLFILANPEGVTKDQINEAIWSEVAVEDLALRLKNTLYRMRRVLGKDAIILVNNRYYFNRDLDYEYDTERFDQLWEEIRFTSLQSEVKKKLAEMLSIYRGPFINEVDYMWAIVERERLHINYRAAVQMYADLLFKSKQYSEAVNHLKELLKYEPELEEVHRYLMRAYANMGDPKNVLAQYQQCESILKESLQINPSQETQDLLRKLIRKV